MPLPSDIGDRIQDLPLVLESEHFIVHYGLRNPLSGRGLGPQGVRDRSLILTYIEALERLYGVMLSEPWSRQPPIVGNENKTQVHVFDTSPFTASDIGSVPFICLSSRSNEPTTQGELHRAAAEAVHEATHVFNFRERPFQDPYTQMWEWFDEGFAVFMETVVVSGNPDYCRFLTNWIDKPETSLDDLNAKYQAGMFIRYLSKKLGRSFVNEVWVESKQTEGPFEALERLMPKSRKFSSSDPNDRDLFGSGYCIDPYFLWDPESACLAPDVLVRYGERAVTETFSLRPNERIQARGVLDHLSCRYYRFYVNGNVTRISVTLRALNQESFFPLKAEIAAVTRDLRRLAVRPFHQTGPEDEETHADVAVELHIDPSDEVNHFVLAVSNCGYKSAQVNTRIPHDDRRAFLLTASAC